MSQLDASPSPMGNVVRWPWITSNAKNIGIFIRLRWVAASCSWRLCGRLTELKVPPIRPAAISSASCAIGISGPMLIRRNCPTFSSSVILPSKSAMNALLSDMETEGAAAGAVWVKAGALARPASRAIDKEKLGDNLNDNFIE